MSVPLHIIDVPTLQSVTAASVFEAFQEQSWAMLLDTCNNQLSDGRYDIIVYSPVVKLVQQSTLLVESASSAWNSLLDRNNNSSDIDENCPFERISEIHQRFCESVQVQEETELPFLCGALGYFNYDLNTRTANIPDANPAQYGTPDSCVGIYDQCLIFDNKLHKVYCCYLDEARAQAMIRLASDYLQSDRAAKASLLSFSLSSEWESNLSVEDYQKNLSKVDEYLHAGDCYQINFAQRFKAAYTGSEWLAYKRLREVNKAPFSAFIRLENACIMSVSPERFLQVKSGQVATKPIKGTRKRAKDAIEDKKLSEELLQSEKDRAENLMIVDLLRNDLSKHCLPHSVDVPALFALESYPAVHHMVSTVLGKLKPEATPLTLLKGAFPGGSITGAPKIRAMQIIQELEPDKRSIYCGSIGYIGVRQDMDTNICIRTVLAEKNHLFCWAGGGIVLDSDISAEYQESLDKVAKILPVLAESAKVPFTHE